MPFLGKWIYGLVVEPRENKLCFTDYEYKKVNMVALKTGLVTPVLRKCRGHPTGLAVDRGKG